MDSIEEFRIDVPQADLDDLRDRLARTRWPDQLPETGWDYGIALDDVRELAEYWRTGYDWRVHERRLNGFPQFTTHVDGQAVHFLHVRSHLPGALPLIMTHGWPGSIVEFIEVIGPLTDPGAHGGDPRDAFHMIVPSSSRPRVLRADAGTGLEREPHCAGVGRAHAAPGLPAVRRAGRRLGLVDLPGARHDRAGSYRGGAPEHAVAARCSRFGALLIWTIKIGSGWSGCGGSG